MKFYLYKSLITHLSRILSAFRLFFERSYGSTILFRDLLTFIGPPEFSDLPTALADGHHSLGEAGNLVSQVRQQQHHHSYVGVLQRPRERFQSSVHGGQNLGITKSLEAAAEHEVFVTLMRAEHLGSF